MKKLRFLIAAALAVGSMAVSVGAVGFTADDDTLQSAITQLRQQWQANPYQRYISFDGDNYHIMSSLLIATENIYDFYFSVDDSRNYHGVANLKTGEIIIPPQYDTVDCLTKDKYLVTTERYTQDHAAEYYFADATGTVTPLNLPAQTAYVESAGEGCFFAVVYEKRPLQDYIYYEQPTEFEYDVTRPILYDENMNVIRDDIDGGIALSTPVFHNGLMAIQTGSTLWEGSVKGAYGNGKYGLMDKTGKDIGKNDFDGIDWRDNRYIGWRGKKFYYLDGTGNEVELSANADEYSTWAQDAVVALRNHSLGSGYYYPRLDITRVDFCELVVDLYRKMNPEMNSAPKNILDTVFSDYEDNNVAVAAALGIVTGYEDGTFRPYEFITREEAATMLDRLYKSLGGTKTAEGSKQYADDAQFGDWSRDSIYTMQNIGIMKGEKNNEFHPDGGYTGEQAIVTIERMYHQLAQ